MYVNNNQPQMLLKYTVNFYIEKRTSNKIDHEGSPGYPNTPILMFFTAEGNRLQYYTGYRIDSWKWNTETQKVRRNNLNKEGISSQVINERLDQLKTNIIDIYQKRKIQGEPVTVHWLRKALDDQLNDRTKKGKTLLELFAEYLEEKRRVNTIGTVKKYTTLRKHLQDFQQKTRFRLEPEEINDEFLQGFVGFLLKDKKFVNSSTAKTIKLLKAFLAWASNRETGQSINQSYKRFKHNLKGVDSFGSSKTGTVIFLTWLEFDHLFNLDVAKHYLAQVRDVFCFLCATGMRYSDVANLKWSNVKTDHIEYSTIKTEEPVIVELNDYSRAILERYRTTPHKDDKCLPVVSNQKMNKYLKELGQVAEFNSQENLVYYKGTTRVEKTKPKWALLTTHIGKKTFITNAFMLGVPIEIIKEWTGNKDDRMFKVYLALQDQHKRREMLKFNKKTRQNDVS